MARKKVMKIPKEVVIKCPNCGYGNRTKVSTDKGLYFLECRGCKQKIEAPKTRCCLVCAFSNKKCPASLVREAKTKGLIIK